MKQTSLIKGCSLALLILMLIIFVPIHVSSFPANALEYTKNYFDGDSHCLFTERTRGRLCRSDSRLVTILPRYDATGQIASDVYIFKNKNLLTDGGFDSHDDELFLLKDGWCKFMPASACYDGECLKIETPSVVKGAQNYADIKFLPVKVNPSKSYVVSFFAKSDDLNTPLSLKINTFKGPFIPSTREIMNPVGDITYYFNVSKQKGWHRYSVDISPALEGADWIVVQFFVSSTGNPFSSGRERRYVLIDDAQLENSENGRATPFERSTYEVSFNALPGGLMKSIVDPGNVKRIFNYNLLGEVKSIDIDVGNDGVIDKRVADLDYNNYGMMKKKSLGGGKLFMTYDYTPRGFVNSTIAMSNNEELLKENFDYYLNGNLKMIKAKGGFNARFYYDAIDRLFKAENHGYYAHSLNYTYNKEGDRLSFNNMPYTYYPGTNRVKSIGQTAYDYDVLGRVTKVSAPNMYTIYTYTPESKVASIEKHFGNHVSLSNYSYYPSGGLAIKSETTDRNYREKTYMIRDLTGDIIYQENYKYCNADDYLNSSYDKSRDCCEGKLEAVFDEHSTKLGVKKWLKWGEDSPGVDYAVGETECCGDDAHEFADYYSDWDESMGGCYAPGGDCSGTTETDPADEACCAGADECVYNGKCYPAGTLLDVSGHSPNDYDKSPDKEICVFYGGRAGWQDADIGDHNLASKSYCEMYFANATWVGANENVPCEPAHRWAKGNQFCDDTAKGYDIAHAGTEGVSSNYCCGDDPHEYYINSTYDGTSACCSNETDVVINSVCYNKNRVPPVDASMDVAESGYPPEWSHKGVLKKPERTADFSGVVNDYLDKCYNNQLGGGYQEAGGCCEEEGFCRITSRDSCKGEFKQSIKDLDECINALCGGATFKDSDGDGIPDTHDKCKSTQEGVMVDKDGCELAPVSHKTKCACIGGELCYVPIDFNATFGVLKAYDLEVDYRLDDAPQCGVPDFYFDEGNSVHIDISKYVYSPDGDSVKFILTPPSSWTGSVTPDGKKINQNAAEVGRYKFSLKAVENTKRGMYCTQNFYINVGHINEPPTIMAPDVVNVEETQTVSFEVVAKDPEHDTVQITADTSGVPGASFSQQQGTGSSTGTLSWTTDYNSADNGPDYYVTFFATDSNRAKSEVKKTRIHVINKNRKPSIAPSNLEVEEGHLATFDISKFSSDPDNDPLVYYTNALQIIKSYEDFDASTGSPSFSDGRLSWVPDYAQASNKQSYRSYLISVGTSDGIANADASMKITVKNNNRLPSIISPSDDSFEVNEGDKLRIEIAASDKDINIDGDTLHLVPSSSNIQLADKFIKGFDENGEVVPSSIDKSTSSAGGKYTWVFEWTPSYDDEGTYNLHLKVSDDSGAYDEKSLTIIVHNTNRKPSIDIPDQVMYWDESKTLDLTSYSGDPDNDALTYSVVQQGDVKCEVSGDTLTMTPTDGYYNTPKKDPFTPATCTVRATDVHGAHADSEFAITVIRRNKLPVVSVEANPLSGYAPLTSQLTCTAGQGDPPYTFRWDFGDGTSKEDGPSANGQSAVSHTFTDPATYTVSCEATDSWTDIEGKNGDSDSASIELEAKQKPLKTVDYDLSNIYVRCDTEPHNMSLEIDTSNLPCEGDYSAYFTVERGHCRTYEAQKSFVENHGKDFIKVQTGTDNGNWCPDIVVKVVKKNGMDSYEPEYEPASDKTRYSNVPLEKDKNGNPKWDAPDIRYCQGQTNEDMRILLYRKSEDGKLLVNESSWDDKEYPWMQDTTVVPAPKKLHLKPGEKLVVRIEHLDNNCKCTSCDMSNWGYVSSWNQDIGDCSAGSVEPGKLILSTRDC